MSLTIKPPLSGLVLVVVPSVTGAESFYGCDINHPRTVWLGLQHLHQSLEGKSNLIEVLSEAGVSLVLLGFGISEWEQKIVVRAQEYFRGLGIDEVYRFPNYETQLARWVKSLPAEQEIKRSMDTNTPKVVVVGAIESDSKRPEDLLGLRKDKRWHGLVLWKGYGDEFKSFSPEVRLVVVNDRCSREVKHKIRGAIPAGQRVDVIERDGTDEVVSWLIGNLPRVLGPASASAEPQAQGRGGLDGKQGLPAKGDAVVYTHNPPRAISLPTGQRIYVVGINPQAAQGLCDDEDRFAALIASQGSRLTSNLPPDLGVLVLLKSVEAPLRSQLGQIAASQTKMCIAIPDWGVPELREWLVSCEIQWGPREQPVASKDDQTLLAFPSSSPGEPEVPPPSVQEPARRFIYEPEMSAAKFVAENYALATQVADQGWESSVLGLLAGRLGLNKASVQAAVCLYRGKRKITVAPGLRRGLSDEVQQRILDLLPVLLAASSGPDSASTPTAQTPAPETALPFEPSEPAAVPLVSSPAERVPTATLPASVLSPARLEDPQLCAAYDVFTARLVELALKDKNVEIDSLRAQIEQAEAVKKAVLEVVEQLRNENASLRDELSRAVKVEDVIEAVRAVRRDRATEHPR
ncbi:MAG: hypothetical protein HYZ51_02415 [Candidatus Doudnabacteria bacterium]|nr:hypothetical protein [Candidatus Doudnabacteria bacterium]